MKNTIELTPEKFREIYSNPKFRNEVARAHKNCNSDGVFKHFQTCSYPTTYIVTESQIEAAKNELLKAKNETFKKHENDLLFVSMGSDYEPRFNDDACNHRIRTEFLNSEGKRFFIEVGTGRGEEIRIDHSIDRDKEIEIKNMLSHAFLQRNTKKYGSKDWVKWNEKIRHLHNIGSGNYKDLERAHMGLKYTKTNVLDLVNKYFDCNFKNIVIDGYDISCADREIICTSPKRESKKQLLTEQKTLF
ncbi:hypothetical protein [Sunxiuqinia indica]|uniref:hypothetical protein n=1 Tax=Sunxiuqinia indica TaxID=2692584 RepID=UPI00135A95DC|nr:hypothetical protein [Sunxiuqinia indica]